MKTLILMRHAKANPAQFGGKDFDRTLADRGKLDAHEMGKRLHKKQFKPDMILCSAAARTSKTAQIIADEVHFPVQEIVSEFDLYEAGLHELTQIIRSVDDHIKSLLIVGHNPIITGIIGYLSGSYIEHVPTSGMASIQFNIQTWKQVAASAGELQWFDFPKNNPND